MGTSRQTEIRADGLSETDEIFWAGERTIMENGPIYASIPVMMARNMGLESGVEFTPGYTPSGQPVVIEEEAIIIRNPENNHE